MLNCFLPTTEHYGDRENDLLMGKTSAGDGEKVKLCEEELALCGGVFGCCQKWLLPGTVSWSVYCGVLVASSCFHRFCLLSGLVHQIKLKEITWLVEIQERVAVATQIAVEVIDMMLLAPCTTHSMHTTVVVCPF